MFTLIRQKVLGDKIVERRMEVVKEVPVVRYVDRVVTKEVPVVQVVERVVEVRRLSFAQKCSDQVGGPSRKRDCIRN